MNRAESTIIGVFLAAACPLLTFVFFWWTAAAIGLYVVNIPDRVVIAAALTGLTVGIVLDGFLLKRWISSFYGTRMWLLFPVYVALCVVAVGFCMGVPVGTFALGLMAGFYGGRRAHYLRTDHASRDAMVRKVALTAALVTTATALPIGILALEEQGVLELLKTVSGFDELRLRGATGFALVGALTVALFVAQYWCSKQTGRIALRIGGNSAQPVTPADAD